MFKEGDKVCYKDFPDICIGSISPDSKYTYNNMNIYQVFTSDDWFKHFAPYGGPNTLSVDADSIMLYKDKQTILLKRK